MSFKIIRCDIKKTRADAIVNIIYIDSSEVDFAPGYTSITPVSGIESKYIINTYIPKHSGNRLIRKVYDKALHLASDNDCRSIAFPLIPEENNSKTLQLFSSETAVNAFTEFLKKYDMEIFLSLSETENIQLSGEMEEDINKLIYDTFPIEHISTKEYYPKHKEKRDKGKISCGFFGAITSKFSFSRSEEQKRDVRLDPENFLQSGSIIKRTGEVASCYKSLYPDEKEEFEISEESSAIEPLESELKKGLKNSEVYAAANISKQYFSKLLKGKVKPSKEKMLALAVGLQLNIDETIDFLGIAGYALSPISQTDIIVKYFINHKEYNVIKIDIVLFDYGLEPLSG